MEKPIFALIAALLAVLITFSLMITAQAQELTVEETFERAAYAYRLDPDLLVSIATLESGYGQSAVAKKQKQLVRLDKIERRVHGLRYPAGGHLARCKSDQPQTAREH